MPDPETAFPLIAQHALDRLERSLVAELGDGDCWRGRLASSALATAVSVTALGLTRPQACQDVLGAGAAWLTNHQNHDGGWGDAPECRSNLSTTLLTYSSLVLLNTLGLGDAGAEKCRRSAAGWLEREIGSLKPERIAEAVLAHYGNDRTFSAPILAACAVCGVLGDDERAWDVVPQLPFELAVLPQCLFRWVRLPVVSYALPALIAIGLVRHHRGVCPRGLVRRGRAACVSRVLNVLERMQPDNGGFLEAAPLTAFVTMGLAGSGHAGHPVSERAISFLLCSQRPDGSWPIDSDLATWLSVQAVAALQGGACERRRMSDGQVDAVADWLMRQQHKQRHPFTGAAPGGWAWTDLPGGVPDADDTSGVIYALNLLGSRRPDSRAAARDGVRWLLRVQNADGGLPTFCRGWGRFPFDRSCPDITAHAIRGWQAWEPQLETALQRKVRRAIDGALDFLRDDQQPDGRWVPLWFGNASAPDEENSVYGTACVLETLASVRNGDVESVRMPREKGVQWLTDVQHACGGWGGARGVPPTVEETGCALAGLARCPETTRDVLTLGAQWLGQRLSESETVPAAPIGLYFSRLWYSERLYPWVFAAKGLRQTRMRLAE